MTLTVLNIRGIRQDARDQLAGAARRRGWTYAQLIEALIELHDVARSMADGGNGLMQAELKALGLQTVRE